MFGSYTDVEDPPVEALAIGHNIVLCGTDWWGLTQDDEAYAATVVGNLSRFGVHSFTAIVDPPQGAILAVGGVERRPYETEAGAVGFRETLFATLSADHRLVYGVDAAEFLDHLRRLLEHPLALVA